MSAGNPWGISFMRMLDMANDSHLFADAPGPGRLPLVEAKMIHQFDHRFGDYADKPKDSESTALPVVPQQQLGDPWYTPQPRYWVDAAEVEARLGGRWTRRWLLGWRDICRATDARTVIAAVIPRVAVNDKFLLLLPSEDPTLAAALYSNLDSFVLDYAARQKVGGTSLKYFTMRQLPVLAPETYAGETPWAPGIPLGDWLVPRVLELTYTAWDLQPFANDCGWPSPPFHWDEERRFLLRCELDAAFFHLYTPAERDDAWRAADGETADDLARLRESFPTPRAAVAYIMDTFPIVRRKDEAKCDGDYRTKRVILEMYDAMQEAIRTGQPYQTRLSAPPADPSCCHPPLPLGILAYGSLIREPGPEIAPHIRLRIDTQTPFPVEYARLSKTRGGAPTLAPHPDGAPVKAQVLVLDDTLSVEDAQDRLWRRETRSQGPTKSYPAGSSPNSIRVERTAHPSVATVLHTDYNLEGKLEHPTAELLAQAAVASVAKAAPGKDGIAYLLNAIAAGIETPLTAAYRAEILNQTGSGSLEDALRKALSP